MGPWRMEGVFNEACWSGTLGVLPSSDSLNHVAIMNDVPSSALSFYDQNAEKYRRRTGVLGPSPELELFVSNLPGPKVLEVGCGSGRESRELMDRGLDVTVTDGSAEMARVASRDLGVDVQVLRHEDVDFEEVYDGIWASATLFHVAREDFRDVLARYARALVPGGVFYASLKVGAPDEDGWDDEGRWFIYVTEGEMERVVSTIPGLEIVRMARSEDVLGRDRLWLSVHMVRWQDGEGSPPASHSSTKPQPDDDG